jgi:hypothetical protein
MPFFFFEKIIIIRGQYGNHALSLRLLLVFLLPSASSLSARIIYLLSKIIFSQPLIFPFPLKSRRYCYVYIITPIKGKRGGTSVGLPEKPSPLLIIKSRKQKRRKTSSISGCSSRRGGGEVKQRKRKEGR